LKHKVENDSRAQTAREIFFNKIKEKNGYKEYNDNVNAVVEKLMSTVLDTGKTKGTFKSSDYTAMSKPVFTLAGKNYLQNDFIKFLESLTHGRLNGPKQSVVRDAFGVYVTNVVTDFQEHKLVEENPEFKILMEEYRDGIMLFELMDRNVWSKATKDSAGLKAFYESHKSKYVWEPGFEGSVYNFKNKASLDTAQLIMKSGNVTDEDLIKALNTQNNPDRVTIQRGRYEFSKFRDATQAELSANKSKVMPGVNGTYKMVVARQIFTTPGIKTLDEARGYVVAEYQDHLEKEWNAMMKKQYPMKLNDKVFKSMVGTK
jgi:peptidyl-prolyl cis-trans isomerase SurA